jgi:hypothetical protein
MSKAPHEQEVMLIGWTENTLFELNFIGLVIRTYFTLFLESAKSHRTGNTARLNRSCRPLLARHNHLEGVFALHGSLRYCLR